VVTFGAAGGLLTYWALQAERIVVLLDLTWLDDCLWLKRSTSVP
jgi:hypothetical protein